MVAINNSNNEIRGQKSRGTNYPHTNQVEISKNKQKEEENNSEKK